MICSCLGLFLPSLDCSSVLCSWFAVFVPFVIHLHMCISSQLAMYLHLLKILVETVLETYWYTALCVYSVCIITVLVALFFVPSFILRNALILHCCH